MIRNQVKGQLHRNAVRVSFIQYDSHIFCIFVTGLCIGSNGSGDHCVYALVRQSLGNLAQAVIGSTQDPLEFLAHLSRQTHKVSL